MERRARDLAEQILSINEHGGFHVLAGSSAPGYSGDGGVAGKAALDDPNMGGPSMGPRRARAVDRGGFSLQLKRFSSSHNGLICSVGPWSQPSVAR